MTTCPQCSKPNPPEQLFCGYCCARMPRLNQTMNTLNGLTKEEMINAIPEPKIVVLTKPAESPDATPRTDSAFESELDGLNVTAGWDFARQLERENNALVKEVEELSNKLLLSCDVKHWLRLREEADQLRTQLAEAVKDKERLDWYNVHHGELIYTVGTGWQIWVAGVTGLHKGRWIFLGKDIRTAIAAAMKGEK